MHIANVMFSRGLGGMEQSLFDYSQTLIEQGHTVTCIISPEAKIQQQLVQLGNAITIKIIKNYGQWDLLAASRLKKLLRTTNPDAIITYGNRAVSLTRQAFKGKKPIIARTPNYSVKRLIGLEGIFHTTKDLGSYIQAKGQPVQQLFHIPNMIRIPPSHNATFRTYQSPPIIGTMGRFVKKKGFAEFIEALALLKKTNTAFKAIIGGEGEEEESLKDLVVSLVLENEVTFCGWVDDKESFFNSIDIFCLPSLHEPFGIILLEAFLYGKPTVTTDSEGPKEIATHEHDALIVPKGRPELMATDLKTLIETPQHAEIYSKNAVETIKSTYDMNIIGKKIDEALRKIVT